MGEILRAKLTEGNCESKFAARQWGESIFAAEFTQPRMSRSNGSHPQLRRYKFGCVCVPVWLVLTLV